MDTESSQPSLKLDSQTAVDSTTTSTSKSEVKNMKNMSAN